jgi:ParB-like chromosome segregation protein Spo0J
MTDDLDYIAEPLREHAVPVDEVTQDPSNVRDHPEKNTRAVKNSLQEFGQRQVLVAREGERTIEAGNLRLECAREMGWSHVAVIFVDDDELEAARYAIADNRSSDLGEWKEDDLGDMLEAIDEPPPGYTDDDVGELLDETDDSLDTDPIEFDEKWEVVVECDDEAEQEAVLDLLEMEGYECRALIS